MRNKFIYVFITILSVLIFSTYTAYADKIVDLMEVKPDIGRVVVEFKDVGGTPPDYSVVVSADGKEWETVAEITDNISFLKREHLFTARSVRYIKIVETGSLNKMKVADVQVYQFPETGLNAAMVYPQPMNGNITENTNAEVKFGKTINNHYLDKLIMTDGHGNLIETNNVLSVNKESIVLTPQAKLIPGEYYNIELKRFNKWGFGINSGAEDGAGGKIFSSLSKIPYGEILNSTDNDETTVDTVAIDDVGKIFEYDLNRMYNNITGFRISFSTTPKLFEIFVSEDGLAWTKTIKHYTKGSSVAEVRMKPTAARFIRLCGVEGSTAVKEFEVFTHIDSVPFGTALEYSGMDSEIEIEFSHQIDIGTVNSDTVKLLCGNTLYDCEYVFDEDKRVLNIIAEEGLNANREHIVCINGVKDAVGRVIENVELAFTTEAEKSLEILTVSDSEYFTNPQCAIYPMFVDNMPYETWTAEGRKSFYQLEASGGFYPYVFEITDGRLPAGITMDESGKIGGTATSEETVQFTVRVTDVKGNSAEKTLEMTANPYRSKWFADAKFGVMTQWGVFSMSDMGYEMTKTTADIENFEKLIDGTFSAAEWAQKLEDMGAKVFNWTVMAGDSIRMFPSKSDSANNAKLSKNLAGELIEECHKRGIKFIGYVAPEYSWANSLKDYNPETQSVSKLVVDTIEELLEIGMDGVWIDAGWSNGYVDWDLMLKTIRTVNPYATIQSNPSVTKTGWIPMYPDVDIQTYECTNIDQTDNALHVGFKSAVEKKMAVEQTGLVGGSWGPSDRTGNLKSTDAIIENIQANWDNGVTYMLVFNASVEGKLVNPLHEESVQIVTDWVKENIDSCSAPHSDLDDSIVYTEEQTVSLTADEGSEIYYTTDGTNPDLNSIKYSSPISIKETTTLKAAAYIDGKCKSEISEFTFAIDAGNESGSIFDQSISADFTEVKNNMMSGMYINVKNNPLTLSKIGKILSDQTDTSYYAVIYELGDKMDAILSQRLDFDEHSENGFSYADIAPIKLKSNTHYYLLIEDKDKRVSISSEQLVSFSNDYIQINDGVFTDCSMTKYYLAEEYTQHDGQPIDFVYDILPEEVNLNLALNAVATLQDNSGNVKEASSGFYEAFKAVDGKKDTYAAANTYAWTLHLDLGEEKEFSAIKLNFKEDLYSTSFAIYTSLDGTDWSVLTQVDKNNSIEHVFNYQSTSARYIRVRSFAPNDKGQTGGQMFISEVEVYKDGISEDEIPKIEVTGNNLASTATVELQDNYNNAKGAWGTNVAKNAIDGKDNTYAAASAYAWTLYMDLGDVYNVSNIKLRFKENSYSTSFAIYTSADGETWITPARLYENNGKTFDFGFVPTDVRYIKVRSFEPSGIFQTGSRMYISELEVYE